MATNRKFRSSEILSIQKVINDYFTSYQYELFDRDWIIFRNLGKIQSIHIMRLPYFYELRIIHKSYSFVQNFDNIRDLCRVINVDLSTSIIHNCNI